MSVIHFNWSKQADYNRRLRSLFARARNLHEICAGSGLDSVYLSAGYQKVVERPTAGYDASRRLTYLPASLAYVEAEALLTVCQAVAPLQLGRTLFLESFPIAWIDSEGREFEVLTVVAARNGRILVATGEEFDLGDAFTVDRQLFRAEVSRLKAMLREHVDICNGEPGTDDES